MRKAPAPLSTAPSATLAGIRLLATDIDGTLTHGVLDARNQVPGARLPTERTWRQAIAVNFWPEHPWGVPRYADSPHYRALALRPSRGLDR